MKSFVRLIQARDGKPMLPPCRTVWGAVVLLLVCLGLNSVARTQAVPTADEGGLKLSAGGTASGYYLGYGQVKVMGGTAFFDADNMHHYGVELEARWLMLHMKSEQTGPAADEHANTYLAGLRYSRFYGRFQPYVKGLAGIGQFNYPYNFAKETDLVAAAGGGVDYRLSRKLRWRAVDFEYQLWPQFTYGKMSSYGLSTGLRYIIR
jgi:hypothetical protein